MKAPNLAPKAPVVRDVDTDFSKFISGSSKVFHGFSWFCMVFKKGEKSSTLSKPRVRFENCIHMVVTTAPQEPRTSKGFRAEDGCNNAPIRKNNNMTSKQNAETAKVNVEIIPKAFSARCGMIPGVSCMTFATRMQSKEMKMWHPKKPMATLGSSPVSSA